MRLVLLFLFLAVVAGIYVMPRSIASYTEGTHIWELSNKTKPASGLQCALCHPYIFDELNLSTATKVVLQAHRNAAGNQTYTQDLLNLTLSNDTDSGVCHLCHVAQIQTTTHTQVTVRVCTDLDCHGNNESTNNTYYSAGSVGIQLGSTNVHDLWFNALNRNFTDIQNETGDNYTQAYWACEGCHTGVIVNITSYPEEFLHNDPSWNSGEPRRYL